MYIARVDSSTVPCTRMLGNSSIMPSQVVVHAHCPVVYGMISQYLPGLSSVVPWFAGTTSTSLVRSGTFTWSPNRSVHLSASALERRQRRQWTAPSTNSLSEVRRVIDCTARSITRRVVAKCSHHVHVYPVSLSLRSQAKDPVGQVTGCPAHSWEEGGKRAGPRPWASRR